MVDLDYLCTKSFSEFDLSWSSWRSFTLSENAICEAEPVWILAWTKVMFLRWVRALMREVLVF